MVEDDLVAFGEEAWLGVAVGAELGGQGMRVFLHPCVLDEHVSEVTVFEQVDYLGQVAVGIQADSCRDLPRGQAEQPDPRAGHPVGQLPAPETERAGISRYRTLGSWSADSR